VHGLPVDVGGVRQRSGGRWGRGRKRLPRLRIAGWQLKASRNPKGDTEGENLPKSFHFACRFPFDPLAQPS